MDNNRSFVVTVIALLLGIGIGILLPGVIESAVDNANVVYLRLK